MVPTTNLWRELDCFLHLDPSKRGFAGKTLPGSLEQAARVLCKATKVAIATGFYIPAASAVENDGPLGAVFLARALEKLGKEVLLLVPEAALRASTVLLSALKLRCRLVALAPGQVPANFVSDLGCDVFVSIEYPGQGIDGECRNMRGMRITSHVPLLDDALAYAKKVKIFTLAVGDGGNELGCGALAREVLWSPGGQLIACSSEADTVLAAGISNWGAYVLVAALSLIENVQLLPTANEERYLLEKLCEVGVVDGCSMNCEQSVDGIVLDQLENFLLRLNNVVEDNMSSMGLVAISAYSE